MLLFVYLLADLDEGRQVDSILKAVGAVKYEYGGWEIANFDTLPLSDSIPVPNGEYRVVDDYKALHLRGVWEYKGFDVYNPPGWIWNDGGSPACWAWGKDSKKSGFVPLRWSIIPLADTFGTYEYEIELSPIYFVK